MATKPPKIKGMVPASADATGMTGTSGLSLTTPRTLTSMSPRTWGSQVTPRAPDSSRGNVAFPDLHHKMCKKIAQLTRVIYHLHTKSEDHAQEMEAQQLRYEAEIEAILLDCNQQMGQLHKQLDRQRDQDKLREAMQQMKAQHEKERQEAFQQIDEIRQRAADNEMAIRTRAEQRIAELIRETESVKNELATRIRGFNDFTKQMDEQMVMKQSATDEQKRKEVEDLVQNSNKRYNDMLAERLAEEERLRSELETNSRAKFEKEKVSAVSSAVSAAVADLAAKKDQEMKDQLARQEYEFSTQRDVFATEMQKLRRVQDELNADKRRLEQDLNETRNQLQSVSMAKSFLESATTRNEADMSTKADELRKLSSQSKNIQSERDELRNALQKTVEHHARESEKIRQECDKQLAQMRMELSVRDEEIQVLKGKLETTEILMKNLREEQERMTSVSEQQQEQMRQQRDIITELKSQIKTLLAKHQEDVQTLGIRHAEELEDIRRNLTADINEEQNRSHEILILKQSQWNDERTQMIQHHRDQVHKLDTERRAATETADATIKSLREELDTLIVNHAKLLAEEQALRKQSDKRSEEELNKARKAHDTEVVRMTTEMTLVQTKCDQLARDIETVQNAANGMETDLTQQIQRLRQQADEDRGRMGMDAEDRLKIQRDRMETEWRDKMTLSLSKAVSEVEQRLTHDKQDSLSRLSTSFVEEKTRLNKARDDAERRVKDLEQQVRGLELRLQAEKDQSNATINIGESTLRQTRENHARELAEMKQQFQSDMTAAEAEHGEMLRRQLQSQRDAITTDFQQEKVRMAHRVADEMDALSDRLTQERSKALDDQRRELEKSFSQRLEAWQAQTDLEKERFKQEISIQEEALREKLEKINGELKNSQENGRVTANKLMEANNAIAQLQSNLKDREQDLLKRMQQFAVDKANLQAEYQDRERRLLGDLDVERRRLEAKSEQELAQLHAELQRAKDIMQTQYDEVQTAYREIQSRFDNRESRQEDVQKILQLRQELRDKDGLLNHAMEELKFFKLELINREEMYNKTFGRQVIVGVLDPRQQQQQQHVQGGTSSKILGGTSLGGTTLRTGGGGGPVLGMSMGNMSVGTSKATSSALNYGTSAYGTGTTSASTSNTAAPLRRNKSDGANEMSAKVSNTRTSKNDARSSSPVEDTLPPLANTNDDYYSSNATPTRGGSGGRNSTALNNNGFGNYQFSSSSAGNDSGLQQQQQQQHVRPPASDGSGLLGSTSGGRPGSASKRPSSAGKTTSLNARI